MIRGAWNKLKISDSYGLPCFVYDPVYEEELERNGRDPIHTSISPYCLRYNIAKRAYEKECERRGIDPRRCQS